MSSTQATDAELVEEARSEEHARRRAAQRTLYERYRGELFSLLVRLLRDRSAAEDLLQETFLRAFQRLDQQQDGRSFRGWLHRIGRNAAIDHLNAAAKAARAAELDPVGRDAPAAAAETRESVVDATAALETLNPEDRSLLLARHGTGLKLTELAVTMSCTERTVRNRLRRAADRWVAAIVARRTS